MRFGLLISQCRDIFAEIRDVGLELLGIGPSEEDDDECDEDERAAAEAGDLVSII